MKWKKSVDFANQAPQLFSDFFNNLVDYFIL